MQIGGVGFGQKRVNVINTTTNNALNEETS